MKHIWLHKSKEDRMWRAWLHIGEAVYHVEIVWLRKVAPGIKLHFGDRFSETPLDWHISFYWFAIFGSVRTVWLGKFAHWIGRGHKRTISLQFFGGSVWWKLWYDDDLGYDVYHQCDRWRRPLLPPWRWGRQKARSWMCLRDGSLDLNPLDAIWGRRTYDGLRMYEEDAILHVNQFPKDSYPVTLTLEKLYSRRRYGPAWVRRTKRHGYRVNWDCKIGIPFRNNSWKGDSHLGGSFALAAELLDRVDVGDWVDQALAVLKAATIRDRERYGYRPEEFSDDHVILGEE